MATEDDLPPSLFLFVEPESAANTTHPPEYPYNNATRTNSGHYFEMDDTKDRERVRLQHRTGTFIEMHPDGTQVNHIVGDSYHIIDKNGVVQIKGQCSITVENDAQLTFNGDLIQTVRGNYVLSVDKDFDIKVNGSSTYMVKNALRLTTTVGGSITLVSAYDVDIDANLQVNGSVSAAFLNSTGGINATGALHANLGISTLGGIIQGGIQPPPFGITAMGSIESLVSVFGMEVYDMTGPMSAFKLKYNAHQHGETESVTTTPTLTVP